ncbi:hypothetical protein, partial [Geobacillus jurassicus]
RFAWWPRRASRTKVRNPRRGSFRNVTHKYFTHTNADRWKTLTIPKKKKPLSPSAKKRAPVLMDEDGARFVGKGDIACSLLLHLEL